MSASLNKCEEIFKEDHLTVSQLIKGSSTSIANGKTLPQWDRVVKVDVLRNDANEDDYIRARTKLADDMGCDDAFYIMNINKLIERYKLWTDKLPKVKPFFAVKSNNDPIFLSLLANIGMGFDCASKREIELVLGLNVAPDNIIFAHPCKQLSHIRYVRDKGVAMMTFDNEQELHKIAAEYKHARLLVRIKHDDPALYISLGDKFGVTVSEACQLVDTAKRLSLNIVGVCFHIGTGMQTPQTFSTAIEMAHAVFEYATSLGYHMTVLDIGGGFPGRQDMNHLFDMSATIINNTLDKLFSNKSDLMIIAEPGQYMCCSCFSLVVNVTSKRSTSSDLFYYVNDGILGSMLRWGFHIDEVVPPRELKYNKEAITAPCTIWGPTCASTDKICETVLPMLDTGDWLIFDELGSYSLSLHSEFNGYPKPQVFWCVRDSAFVVL